jgi:hypothetical protein
VNFFLSWHMHSVLTALLRAYPMLYMQDHIMLFVYTCMHTYSQIYMCMWISPFRDVKPANFLWNTLGEASIVLHLLWL